ncbi:hypothetical protein ACWELJ_07810 [Nocardia sp. NPDC004582]
MRALGPQRDLLLDGAPGTEFRDRLARMNEPLFAQLRRHAHAPELPEWLEADLAAAARTLLTAR